MADSSPEPVALVTGASSGIGAAFARALRRRGRRLVLVARRADRLRVLADELGGPSHAIVVPADLVEPGACARLHAEVTSRGLAVDLLVNNAGAGHSGRFHEEPLEKALGMVDLNLRSVVELARRFLPGMVARGSGQIINVASTAAFQPIPYLNIYAATKSFVLSFTEGLASELAGTGIRVQALCPGLTASEFQAVAGTDKVFFNKMPKMTPDQVVAASLSGLDRNRLLVIPGLPNRLVVTLQRFAPRRLVRSVAGRLFAPAPPPASR